MSRLFGTDGVRGVANTELTPELAFNLGKVGTYVLRKSKQNPLVLIGKDTRLSGDLLENAITSGILSMGGNVVKVGILPTPAIAYLVKHMKADAGVMISASHNTYEFNGIKFFNSEGFKLDDDIEDEIEDIIVRDMDVNIHIEGDRLGRCIEAMDDGAGRYAEFLKSTIDVSLDDGGCNGFCLFFVHLAELFSDKFASADVFQTSAQFRLKYDDQSDNTKCKSAFKKPVQGV